jgi:hypothetical protein
MAFFCFFQARKFSSFLAVLVFCAGLLHAAPADKGFALAPPAPISAGEARVLVLSAAAQYEHTPYRYGGLDKRGLDCSGLVYVSFQDALGVAVHEMPVACIHGRKKYPLKTPIPAIW